MLSSFIGGAVGGYFGARAGQPKPSRAVPQVVAGIRGGVTYTFTRKAIVAWARGPHGEYLGHAAGNVAGDAHAALRAWQAAHLEQLLGAASQPLP